MTIWKTCRIAVSAISLAGLGNAAVGCGSEFTCADERTCAAAPIGPDGGGRGGSNGRGSGGTGASGTSGSGGTAGASGSSGSGGTGAAGNGGSSGSAGSAGASQEGGIDAGHDAAPDARSACEMEKPNAAVGVFVSKTGSDAPEGGTCGTMSAPCVTIKKAISLAGIGQTIYVATGTYEEDAILLKTGLTLQGGWEETARGSWKHLCSAERKSAVVIRAKSADRTLSAVDLGGKAILETLTVASKTAAPAAGQSLYGIFATGATTEVVLQEVAIEVGPAGAGAPGQAGGDGANPAASCAAGTGSDGATAGSPGTGALAGTFGTTGYSASAGIKGGTGSNGSDGTGAPATECIQCPNSGAACQSHNVCGPLGCRAVCDWTSAFTSCGEPGTNGCGGGGGLGGGEGRGGGSSVGILAWNAKVQAESGRIAAGKGGDGGAGAGGGRGRTGSAAAPGRSGVGCSICGGAPPTFPCATEFQVPAAGNPGGNGGAGKDGGAGGGGSGGHSYAIYKGGTAMVTVAPEVQLVAGTAGTGAGTGASKGADGVAKPIGP